MEEVLTLLHQTREAQKLAKGHFFQQNIKYLGHIFMPGRLVAASKNVDAIKTAVFPTNGTQMTFLGASRV